AGHALEADHHLGRQRLLLEAEDAVEGALSELGAFLPELAQELERRRLRIGGDQVPEPAPGLLRHGRATNASLTPGLGVVGFLDRRLLGDPLNRAPGD